MATPFYIQNITNTTNAINFAQAYLQQLPLLILSGDASAIFISLIGFFIFLEIVNKLTSAMLFVIKRIILFVITGLAAYYFGRAFMLRLNTIGLTLDTIILGFLGTMTALAGLVISVYYLIRETNKMRKPAEPLSAATPEKKEDTMPDIKQDVIAELRDIKSQMSLQMIRHDKNLLAILVYLVIAEFGVFSSVTISAPKPEVGLAFFGIFLLGTFLFIKQSYKKLSVGFFHLFSALVIGGALSVILGNLWGNIPLETLLSFDYFSTNSLVALITGVVVSLFMGSK